MALDQVSRRGFPVFVVLLLGLVAYLQARAAMQLVGAALIQTASVAGNWVDRSLPPPPRRTALALERDRPGETSPLPAAVAPSDPLSWPDCEGVELLIVTESNDPSWSLSTLRWQGESRARLRRVGDDVAGKQVAFIGYNPRQLAPSVWLAGGGTFCQSLLFRPPLATKALAEPAATDTGVRVDRSVVDTTLEDPSSIMRSVRVVPEKKDGVVVGLRLFGIKPNTLLGSLGLKNGDRLESVNGFSVAIPEQALQAYARLRSAQRLNVRLNRSGQTVDITIDII
jgi:general secretion pathway protein C